MFKSKFTKWANKNVPIINKGFDNVSKDVDKINELNKELYSLYERLGQKVKDNKVDTSMIFIELFKYLGVKLTEDGKIVKTKIKKDARTISTSTKNNKRKSK